MLIALPLAGGEFCPHFGRLDQIAVFDVHCLSGPPPEPLACHDRPRTGCDSLPGWFEQLGVDRVLVAGIGAGALHRLQAAGIETAGVDQPHVDPVRVLADHLAQGASQPPAVCSAHEVGDHQHHHCSRGG
ncbi:MAG: NifB/NifX family molybdenum-iron cluster-binding protein [Phycisphaeraceae bacterium]